MHFKFSMFEKQLKFIWLKGAFIGHSDFRSESVYIMI